MGTKKTICPNCGHDQDGGRPTHCLSCSWPLPAPPKRPPSLTERVAAILRANYAAREAAGDMLPIDAAAAAKRSPYLAGQLIRAARKGGQTDEKILANIAKDRARKVWA